MIGKREKRGVEVAEVVEVVVSKREEGSTRELLLLAKIKKRVAAACQNKKRD